MLMQITAQELAVLTPIQIFSVVIISLVAVILALSGVVVYIFRTFWARTNELEDLLIETSKAQAAQLASLEQIPRAVRENNAHLRDFITKSEAVLREVQVHLASARVGH